MPAWNITTIIAGVDFSNCQALIVDGQKRASDYVGSIITAADGTKHRQRVKTGGVGKSVGRNYGVNLPQVEATLVQAALAAIATAEDANIPFRVQMENAMQEIDDYVWPDDEAGDWVTWGGELEGIMSDVVFRFASVAPYTPP